MGRTIVTINTVHGPPVKFFTCFSPFTMFLCTLDVKLFSYTIRQSYSHRTNGGTLFIQWHILNLDILTYMPVNALKIVGIRIMATNVQGYIGHFRILLIII